LDSKVALFSYEKDKLKRSFVTQFFEENEEWLSREVLIFKSMTKTNNQDKMDEVLIKEFDRLEAED